LQFTRQRRTACKGEGPAHQVATAAAQSKTEPGLASGSSYLLRQLQLKTRRGGTSSNAEALTLDLQSARRQTTRPTALRAKQFAALAGHISGVLIIAGVPFPLQKRLQLITTALVVRRKESPLRSFHAIRNLRLEEWLGRHKLLLLERLGRALE